ncbi:hypothetical protein GEMRC1_012095 [Eukaryota sp. GEM-RC1]
MDITLVSDNEEPIEVSQSNSSNDIVSLELLKPLPKDIAPFFQQAAKKLPNGDIEVRTETIECKFCVSKRYKSSTATGNLRSHVRKHHNKLYESEVPPLKKSRQITEYLQPTERSFKKDPSGVIPLIVDHILAGS